MLEASLRSPRPVSKADGAPSLRRILRHLRTAAGPDTKLLIVGQVLPLACAEEASVAFSQGSLAPANSPLLPNLGKAYAVGYHMDILVCPRRLVEALLPVLTYD